ncbi:MAG: amidase, partial [Halobacteriales archaeon]
RLDEQRAELDPSELGPLHGVPIALKDLFGFKRGVRNTFGCKPLEDFVAPENAAFVERLEDAGAVVVGKTNAPEFGHLPITTNDVSGTTYNPWDGESSVGGSSGGAAAAVAAGMVPFAQGSDSGGSIRIPAAACGVYGFKGTHGRVPIGAGPDVFAGHTPYAHVGPLTRSVEDAALAMDVMAGPHQGEPDVQPDDGTDYVAAAERGRDDDALEGVTLGYSPGFGDTFEVEPVVRDVLDDAVDAFAAAGADTQEAEFPLDKDASHLANDFTKMFAPALAHFARLAGDEADVDLLGERRDELTTSLQGVVAVAESLGALDRMDANRPRTEVASAFASAFDDVDLLATAAICVPTPGAEEFNVPEVDGTGVHPMLGWFTCWLVNMTGHPTAVVPAGWHDGLPVGLQLVGPMHDDEAVLAASAAFEKERPWASEYPA